MPKVTTHVQDPHITIEHEIHRLEDGSYTYSTRTRVEIDDEISHAAALAAELATTADTIARQELVRRLTRDVEMSSDPEVVSLWNQAQRMAKSG